MYQQSSCGAAARSAGVGNSPRLMRSSASHASLRRWSRASLSDIIGLLSEAAGGSAALGRLLLLEMDHVRQVETVIGRCRGDAQRLPAFERLLVDELANRRLRHLAVRKEVVLQDLGRVSQGVAGDRDDLRARAAGPRQPVDGGAPDRTSGVSGKGGSGR